MVSNYFYVKKGFVLLCRIAYIGGEFSMNGEERKKLRDEILQQIYEHHFANNATPFRESRESLSQNNEKNLAIHYLLEKGYLKEERLGLDNLLLSITTDGIDYIEQN